MVAGVRVKRAGWVAAALLFGAPAAAQQAPADTARVHEVRPGDTLWDLARQYLRSPYSWPEIFRLNQGTVENPNLIYPREQLRIPGVGAEGAAGLAPAAPDVPAAAGRAARAVAQEPAAPGRTVFFESEARAAGPLFREREEDEVPTVARGDYYGAGLLVPEAEVRPVGRLLRSVSPSVVTNRIPQQIDIHALVYMSVLEPGAVRVGDRFHLFHEGRRVHPYGRIYVPTGVAEVVAVDGPTATVRIRELYDAVEVGNLAVPMPSFQVPVGVTPRPATGLEGRIVAFQDRQAVHSIRDVAFVDLGTGAGLTEGDELVALLPPPGQPSAQHPEIVVARLQVVRATERTAAARVIEMQYPALEPGLRVRLVRKMP